MDVIKDNAIENPLVPNEDGEATKPKTKKRRKPKTKKNENGNENKNHTAGSADTDNTASSEDAEASKNATTDASDFSEIIKNVTTDAPKTEEIAEGITADALKDANDMENISTDTPSDEDNIKAGTNGMNADAHLKESTHEEQTLDELLFSLLSAKSEDVEESEKESNDEALSESESTARKLKTMIEEELDAKAADEAAEYGNVEDDAWDDEFLDIPDSFTPDEDDDFQLSEEEEAGSIAALIYDDDDSTANTKSEKREPVSFASLISEMQRIKKDAKELRGEFEEEKEDEKPQELENQEQISFDDEIYPKETYEYSEADEIDMNDAVEVKEASPADDIKKPKKPIIPTTIKVKKPISEHVVTIDRAKVKHEEEVKDQKDRIIDIVFDVAELFIFTLLAVMLVTSLLFRHIVVEGGSMKNTLESEDHLITSDLFYTPKRGDIVVCNTDSNSFSAPVIIKRVIAVGGDIIEIRNDIVYVYENDSDTSGVQMDESAYVNLDSSKSDTPPTNMERITVPEGMIFVMGDNRYGSVDSRGVRPFEYDDISFEDIIFISEDAVVGRVLFRFYSATENLHFDLLKNEE